MVPMLDRIEQRVVGVLIEKALAVPDSYPLTDSLLLGGCNQKSNRDPEMALEIADLNAALAKLTAAGWVTRVEGGRAARTRVEVDAQLGVEVSAQAVLAELLLRGPQAPGALKARIARMGVQMTPDQIHDLLRGLRSREPALVEQLPRRPRERDWRWGHCLGPVDADPLDSLQALEPPPGAVAHDRPVPVAPPPATEPRPVSTTPAAASGTGLEQRVAALEREVAELRRELDSRNL